MIPTGHGHWAKEFGLILCYICMCTVHIYRGVRRDLL